MNFELNNTILACLLLTLTVIGGFIIYPWVLRTSYGIRITTLFSSQSFSITAVRRLAARQADMTDTFKSFYDMKYESAVFVIKGLGGTITLFITTFIEKIVKDEKSLTQTDEQLLVVTALMLVLLVALCFRLRLIVVEYGETLRIYNLYRRP